MYDYGDDHNPEDDKLWTEATAVQSSLQRKRLSMRQKWGGKPSAVLEAIETIEEDADPVYDVDSEQLESSRSALQRTQELEQTMRELDQESEDEERDQAQVMDFNQLVSRQAQGMTLYVSLNRVCYLSHKHHR